jgi:hypothetical protein
VTEFPSTRSLGCVRARFAGELQVLPNGGEVADCGETFSRPEMDTDFTWL